jgi:hypothetical protein
MHEEKEERKEERLALVQSWRENSRARWSVLEHIWSWKLKNKMSGLKSEILGKLHCNSKCFLLVHW